MRLNGLKSESRIGLPLPPSRGLCDPNIQNDSDLILCQKAHLNDLGIRIGYLVRVLELDFVSLLCVSLLSTVLTLAENRYHWPL